MKQYAPNSSFKHVLVCRPEPEAQELVNALKKHGISGFAFPTLATRPIKQGQGLDTAKMAQAQAYVFVSPRAVHYAFSLMTSSQIQYCQNRPCFAVGFSTAQALREQGVLQVLAPQTEFNSEALLALEALQPFQVQGQAIVIVSGAEGRELMESTLKQRGAIVHKMTVYESFCPVKDASSLIRAWQDQPFDAVVVTSQHMLENLWGLLGEHRALLQKSCITVLSERTKTWAKAQGIVNWIEVKDPSTAGLLQCLVSSGCFE